MKTLTLIVLLAISQTATAQCGNQYCVMCYGNSAIRALQRLYGLPTETPQAKPEIASSPQEVVDAAIEFAELTPDDIVYDLGCGDGRVLKAASAYGARAVGIEKDKEVAAIAKQNLKGVARTLVVVGDMTKYYLNKPSVVYMYLDEDLMRQVVPKLTGARLIISYSHPIPGMINESLDVGGRPVYFAKPQIQYLADSYRSQ